MSTPRTTMQRTNVYADPADLAIIKQASARRGVPEAELIREGIRLAALGAREWDEPLVHPDETIDLSDGIGRDELRRTRDDVAAAKARRLDDRR